MKTIGLKYLACIAVAAGLLSTAQANAQETAKILGTFKDWEVQSFQQDGKKVCNMFTKPTKSEGDYKERGDVYMFVTNRPADNVTDEFSVQIGYTFKTGAPVSATVSGNKFEMFSQGDFAWLHNDKDQRALIRAMRAGADIVVEGISSRGTKTTDTFSLSGFTAAHNMLSSACR